MLLLYLGFPQARWKLFIVQQRSLLPDATKSPAPPTLLTAGLQNMQTDTASLDSQSPVKPGESKHHLPLALPHLPWYSALTLFLETLPQTNNLIIHFGIVYFRFIYYSITY